MQATIGIDEVGRGSWAGPLLVVAARQIGHLPSNLKDSKLLNKTQRRVLYSQITQCCEFGEGWVSARYIDSYGLTKAMQLAVKKALKCIGANNDAPIIMDGNVNYVPRVYKNVVLMVDADKLAPIVSAASIYAKIKRDEFMTQKAKVHPMYGFDQHVGYGTQLHREAIIKHGTCALHRLSFKPMSVGDIL